MGFYGVIIEALLWNFSLLGFLLLGEGFLVIVIIDFNFLVQLLVSAC